MAGVMWSSCFMITWKDWRSPTSYSFIAWFQCQCCVLPVLPRGSTHPWSRHILRVASKETVMSEPAKQQCIQYSENLKGQIVGTCYIPWVLWNRPAVGTVFLHIVCSTHWLKWQDSVHFLQQSATRSHTALVAVWFDVYLNWLRTWILFQH